jgi:hypothetical protein
MMTRHNGRARLLILGLVAATLGIFQAAQAAGPLTTLSQTSVQGAALAVFNGRLYMAWTGTDNPNHLNVAYTTDGVNFTAPVVIPNNSSVAWAGPGLTVFNGKLYLSWTGGSSFVNYISSSDGVTWSNKVLTAWKAQASTALTVNSAGTVMYLAFADLSSQHLTQVYNTSDGVNWGPFATENYQGRGSPFSPAILGTPSGLDVGFASFPTSGSFNPCPWNCIVLNGVELVPGPLNPGTSAPGTTGTAGPGLGYFNSVLYIAWNGAFSGAQGTTPHIWIASSTTYPMPYFDTLQACIGNPALISYSGHLYMVWTGSDSGQHLNIQWVL